MRTLLLAGVAIVSLACASAVKAADIYEPAPGYGAAPPAYEPPPPNYGPPPPRGYRPLPRYGYAPPAVTAAARLRAATATGLRSASAAALWPPPVVAYDDDEQEFASPPRIYRDAPVYAQRPHYRDCWWSPASAVVRPGTAGRLPDAERDASALREHS